MSEPEFLYVQDTTATADYPTRTHELVVDGAVKRFTFNVGERHKLPVEIALRFLKVKSFIVTDENEKRYDPTPVDPQASDFQLADNEVVALVSELSTEALVIRAKQIPGGEKMKAKDGREALIEFVHGSILKKRAEKAAVASNSADGRRVTVAGDPAGGDDMTASEVDRMFADA
jgi:hypothetical protein